MKDQEQMRSIKDKTTRCLQRTHREKIELARIRCVQVNKKKTTGYVRAAVATPQGWQAGQVWDQNQQPPPVGAKKKKLCEPWFSRTGLHLIKNAGLPLTSP